MQHKITIAILQALYEEFQDSVNRYEDWVEQELVKPAFYILCINTDHKQYLGNCYRRSQSYDIQYFPETQGKGMNQEFAEVTERLYDCLEYITADEKTIRGLNMHTQLQEGALHFFVDYELSLRKQTVQEPCMEELNTKGGIKIDSKKE